jgi:hypothetical protein
MATVTRWSGRYTIWIRSPARIWPSWITRRYGPGRPASVNRLIQPGRPSHAWKVWHGIRGLDTSTITSRPMRQRSPIRAPLTSTPAVVRFSPNMPSRSGTPSSACHMSRSSLA